MPVDDADELRRKVIRQLLGQRMRGAVPSAAPPIRPLRPKKEKQPA